MRAGDQRNVLKLSGIFQRQADADRAAINFDPTEGVVIRELARRQLRHAELGLCRFHVKMEAVAIHVVFIGNLPARFQRVRIQRPRGKLESLLRRQQGRHGAGRIAQQEQRQQPVQQGAQVRMTVQHDEMPGVEGGSVALVVLVSAATQLR